MLPLSHDEVVHGKGALIAKMPGDPWQKYATLRLLYGYQWTLPGKKLLFMGDELGVWSEWNHDTQLDWAIGDAPGARRRSRGGSAISTRAYREHTRAARRATASRSASRGSSATIATRACSRTLRTGEAGDPPIVVVANFTPVPRDGYRLGVPRAGFWREILNSDATIYGGSGVGNRGGMDADATPCRGHAQSLVVTVPPLGLVVFVAER